MHILIIAPHPDDEVVGCGGTIANSSAKGDQIHVCYITKAYTPDWSQDFLKERPNEIKKANLILGVAKSYFLDFPTVKLDTLPQKQLNEAIYRIINEIRPDILYIPHKNDLNKDHRLVFEACLVASRPHTNSIKKVLSYETPSETDFGRPIGGYCPNVYEDISKTFVKKIEAIKAYPSEIKEFPHPRSIEAIEALAKIRGAEAYLKLAEAFILIREINKT